MQIGINGRSKINYRRAMNLLPKKPILIQSVRDWIDLNPDKINYIEELVTPESDVYSLPKTISGEKLCLNKGQEPHSIFKRYIAEIKNVKLTNLHGQLLLEETQIPIETGWIRDNINPSKRPYRNSFFKIKVLTDGPYFSCLLFWSQEYYHWHCDILQRLYDVLQRLPNDTKFIVPYKLSDWKIESLKAMGITKEQLYLYDGKNILSIKRFIYAPPVGMTGDNFSVSAQWLSQKLRVDKLSKPRKIYISRSKAKSRHLINEGSLMKILETYGFEKVVAEDLSYNEQRQLFASAEVIVAPHGAGLTNMLFCNQSCTIIEIFEPNSVRRCYWTLANALEFPYYCHVGKAVENDFEYNLSIDVTEFMTLLQSKQIV